MDTTTLPSAFLRREALAAGVSDKRLTGGVRSGSLVRIRHGVYADAAWWAGADDRQRHHVFAHAVLRLCRHGVVLSHLSAAVEHDLDLWRADLRRVHLTHAEPASGRAVGGVVHHRGRLRGVDLRDAGVHLVTTVARTVVDCASLMTVEQGRGVADSALRTGQTTKQQLWEAFFRAEGSPGFAHVRLVVGRSNALSGSAGETRCRAMFMSLGLPAPVLQYVVRDTCGEFVARTDFAWPELGLIIEFDGLQKYRAGSGDPAEIVIREKLREDRIREVTGWRVIRLTWADLAHPERVLARIRAALAGRAA